LLDCACVYQGIIPRSCEEIFDKAHLITEDETLDEIQVKASFIEIYKEEVMDLLNPGSHGKLKVCARIFNFLELPTVCVSQ